MYAEVSLLLRVCLSSLYSPSSELPLPTVLNVSIMLLLLLIQIPDEDDELREKEQGNIRQSGIMIIQLRSRKPDGLSHYDLYVHLY